MLVNTARSPPWGSSSRLVFEPWTRQGLPGPEAPSLISQLQEPEEFLPARKRGFLGPNKSEGTGRKNYFCDKILPAKREVLAHYTWGNLSPHGEKGR